MKDLLIKIKNFSIITIIASFVIGLVLLIWPNESITAVSILTVIALVLWFLCFNRFSKLWAYLLTAVTAVIFMMSGLLQVKTLLLTAGVVYLIGQLYVTNKYVKSKTQ